MSKHAPKSKAVKAVKRVKKTTAEGAKALTAEEYVELESLVQESGDLNRDLVEAGLALDRARSTEKTAQETYREIQARLALVHAQAAPLFHRLPAA